MMQAMAKIEDCLPEDGPARASLLGEAVRLLALIAPCPESASYLELLGPATPPPGTLDEARRHVARRATALPLAALLLARPDPGGLHADRLDRLRAWVLVAALAAITGSYADHSAWREAARAARHLCIVADLAACRQRVPDLSPASLPGARREFEAWAKREAEAGSSFAPRLQCIVRVLAQLGGQARRRILGRTHARLTPSERFAAAVGGVRPVVGAEASFMEASCADFDFDAEDLHSVEEAADVARLETLHLVTLDGDPFRQDAVADLEAWDDLIEDDGAAITATRQLTRSEARQLARGLRLAFESGPDQPGVTMLAASLLTGRTMAELLALPVEVPGGAGRAWWRQRNGEIALCFAPAVTDAPKPPANGYGIVLPAWLSDPLGRVLAERPPADRLEDQARTWLARQFGDGRAPRISRVAAALGAALTAQGVDTVLTGLLTGADIRHTPQLYYARVEFPALEAAYRVFADAWLGLDDPGPRVIPTGRATVTGSRRVPAEASIRALFEARQDALAAASLRLERRELGAVAEYHGAFVNLVTLILLWATGRRPHRIVLPPFAQMLRRGPHPSVRIEDKGNRSVDDARWLPLPQIAIAALNGLEEHLGFLHDWARLVSPSVAQAIEKTLAGTFAPIWYLPPSQAEVTPLTCREFWLGNLPSGLHRNLFRHHWRTEFLREGIPGWAADAWMGHGGWRSAQYLAASGYAASDLASISDLIDRKSVEIGITLPEPRRMIR